MLTRYMHGDLTWIDLESPTQDEARALMEEFSLDPLAVEELLLPSLKPKVDVHEGHIYVILHFPAERHSHASNSQEIDFIIGEKFIITARYETIDPLHKFSKVFEVNSILDRHNIGDHAGYIFFYMVRKLYRSVEHELEYAATSLADIENKMFSGMEKAMVVEISKSSKELLSFKRTLLPHREIFESLEAPATSLFGDRFKHYVRALMGEQYRVYQLICSYLDSVSELRETNNSVVATQQNEVMKILTIITCIISPLALITSVFSMNTATLPFAGFDGDFWWIILALFAIAGSLFTFFKTKGWL